MKRIMSKTSILLTLVIALALTTLFSISSAPAFAQEAANPAAQAAPAPASTETKTGFSIPFSVGQDNAYLCQSGKCFFAVGGGVDVIGFEKAVGSKGSVLDVKLHAMMLSRVSDNQSGTFAGAAATLDVMKLITGAKLSVLIDKLSLLIGPAVAYDADKGSIAYGGMVNLNYKF